MYLNVIKKNRLIFILKLKLQENIEFANIYYLNFSHK